MCICIPGADALDATTGEFDAEKGKNNLCSCNQFIKPSFQLVPSRTEQRNVR
uniref:Uncharacterized protein AlNc14C11G1315 n=1 Tax=Albugo laibachii Nc14 TaxID=890382 RepID=F0W2T3_9STRA|nr:conserved hypothetical protein [Albugo laibachii Nc14]|eukprot:CCA15369.1 conserved hypothetical protein [Albugo laibachii Nc14]